VREKPVASTSSPRLRATRAGSPDPAIEARMRGGPTRDAFRAAFRFAVISPLCWRDSIIESPRINWAPVQRCGINLVDAYHMYKQAQLASPSDPINGQTTNTLQNIILAFRTSDTCRPGTRLRHSMAVEMCPGRIGSCIVARFPDASMWLWTN
jgi:hypothetical protein